MANQKQDILSRLADKGEGALTRVAGSQTTARVVESVTGLRERMDDVQKKVRGLDELETASREAREAARGAPEAQGEAEDGELVRAQEHTNGSQDAV